MRNVKAFELRAPVVFFQLAVLVVKVLDEGAERLMMQRRSVVVVDGLQRFEDLGYCQPIIDGVV